MTEGKNVKKDEFCQYALDAFKPVETMIKMVPADKLDWKPGPNFMTLGNLIHHLSSGMGAELRMLTTNSWPKPEEMEASMKAGAMPSCTVEEALANIEKDKKALSEVLAGVTEDEFAGKVYSTPWGWQNKLERMALDFKEHFTNHKMQLFTYLKLLGYQVNTETLYMG